MSAYRFCRTDDIALLVEALNRCWAPYFPGEPPATVPAFKRAIRDLQIWCSSCMVAFTGADPVGVLIGAKRSSATLVYKIAVRPDHRRQGHGRHLLTSLASKLAILGPPRIVAEVPESLPAALALFSACGYVEEAVLTDYVLEQPALTLRQPWLPSGRGRETSEHRAPSPGQGVIIPLTIDDLAANGLLREASPPVCWERSVETLMARKAEIAGLAVATDEQIEAYLLYVTHGMLQEETRPSDSPKIANRSPTGPSSVGGTAEILALRSLIDHGAGRLQQLLSRLFTAGYRTIRFPKVNPQEISKEILASLGFRAEAAYRLYATTARPG